MNTKTKLAAYEQAIIDYQRRLRAHEASPFTVAKPVEPNHEHYGLNDGLEVWAAVKIRSKLFAAEPSTV